MRRRDIHAMGITHGGIGSTRCVSSRVLRPAPAFSSASLSLFLYFSISLSTYFKSPWQLASSAVTKRALVILKGHADHCERPPSFSSLASLFFCCLLSFFFFFPFGCPLRSAAPSQHGTLHPRRHILWNQAHPDACEAAGLALPPSHSRPSAPCRAPDVGQDEEGRSRQDRAAAEEKGGRQPPASPPAEGYVDYTPLPGFFSQKRPEFLFQLVFLCFFSLSASVVFTWLLTCFACLFPAAERGSASLVPPWW